MKWHSWATILIEAITAYINNEGSIAEVAKKYVIPKSTLGDHIKGNWNGTEKRPVKRGRTDHIGAGRPTQLDKREEAYLIVGIKHIAALGWPLQTYVLRCVIKEFFDITKRENCFKDNMPGSE